MFVCVHYPTVPDFFLFNSIFKSFSIITHTRLVKRENIISSAERIQTSVYYLPLSLFVFLFLLSSQLLPP